MFGRIRPKRTLVLSAFLLALVLAFVPRLAWADDYEIDRVDIDATVAADGSLSVVESRTFDFDGSFHGVYWEIPTGSYGSRQIETSIDQVGELVGGAFVPFEESYSGDEHTYQLDDYGSYIRVKLYSAHSYEDATFVIGYTDTNLVSRYDDVSELYWKFVSDGWDVESQNVTCTVHLPVPEGRTIVPEEDVRAWGHGPLDADVNFEGNDVVYRVPGVGTSEFAEARITFPESWTSEAPSLGGKHLPEVLEEEQRWADEANARRDRARLLTYGGSAGLLATTLATIFGSIAALTRYRRTHRPQFDDEYFRDVPSDDHPAVLGALYRDGNPSDEDFTATLMRLTDLGAVRLDLVTLRSKGLLGREKTRQDYRLTCLPQAADMSLDAIDRKALHTLFLDIARRAPHHDGDPEDAEIIYFGDIEKVGRKHPESFDSAYRGWQATVEGEVSKRRFFKSDQKTGRGLAGLCMAVAFMLFFATVFFMVITEAWLIGIVLLVLQAVSAALAIVAMAKCKSISQEAIELKAQLEALRRWLKDFTRLKEAVPHDVVLWNRLLVMAVVLGVADEVIKQLKVAVPELMTDPAFMPTYGWYHNGPAGRPYSSFQSGYGSAHSVSTAKLSSSSSSSGGGGGGGFSGGGGGGFGGGGGGGAF